MSRVGPPTRRPAGRDQLRAMTSDVTGKVTDAGHHIALGPRSRSSLGIGGRGRRSGGHHRRRSDAPWGPTLMAKVLYKPIGMVVSVIGGLIASVLFKRMWKLIAHDDETPAATQRRRTWTESSPPPPCRERSLDWSRPSWTEPAPLASPAPPEHGPATTRNPRVELPCRSHQGPGAPSGRLQRTDTAPVGRQPPQDDIAVVPIHKRRAAPSGPGTCGSRLLQGPWRPASHVRSGSMGYEPMGER